MKKIIFFLILLTLILFFDLTLWIKVTLIFLLVIIALIVLFFIEYDKTTWKRVADSDEFKKARNQHRKSGTLKEIEDFTKKVETTKNLPLEQYKEPKITKKIISEFSFFAQKVKLSPSEDNSSQSKQLKKLSEIDFQGLDWGDIHVEFQLNADVITKWWGNITIVEFGFDEIAYTLYGEEVKIPFKTEFAKKNHKGIIKIFDKVNITSCGYDDSFKTVTLKLAADEDCYIKSREEWGGSYDFSESFEQSYHFYHGPETWEPNIDIIGPEFYHEEINADNVFEWNSMEGDLGYVGVKNLQLDIPLIAIYVKDQEIDHQFIFKKELRHLIVLLMSIYRKDIAQQINQALKAKDS